MLKKIDIFNSTFLSHEDELEVVRFRWTRVIIDEVGSSIGQLYTVFKQMANVLTEDIFKSSAELVYLVDLFFVYGGFIDSKLSRVRQEERCVFDMAIVCEFHFLVCE